MTPNHLTRLHVSKVILVAELITATAAGQQAVMKSIILKLSDVLTSIKAAEESPVINPEQVEALKARRIVLMAEIDCLLGAREAARKQGDAETFLATYNQWSEAWEELRELEEPLIRLSAEERKRRNPPDDPLAA